MRAVLALTLLTSAACGGGQSARPVTAKPAADAGDPTGSHKAQIAAHVQPMIDAEIATGIVVGLYDAGRLEIYGFGKGPDGKPPTGRTLFELGSVTKVYTGLLFADAVQRKEVELDTPVADLLPPGVTVPTSDGKTITLRHLSLHSSGLPRLPPSLVARATAPDPYAGYGENALYADLVRTQVAAPPGTTITYSNYGAGLLGHALGRRIGTGYRKALESRVLGPLELSDTFFAVPAAAAPRRAQGTNEELVRVPPWTWDALAGAGALVSSARDQLKMIDAQLDAAAGGKQTLRRAMALAQEPMLEGTGANASLGWQIDAAGRYWHNGTTGGQHAFVGFDPKTRRGIVILSSTATALLDQLSLRFYKILAGEEVKPTVIPTEAQLASYAGTYDFAGQKLKMIAQGKRIYVEGPGEPKIRMLPISDHEFWIDPLSAIVVFQQDAGKTARAVFIVGDRQLTAPRVAE